MMKQNRDREYTCTGIKKKDKKTVNLARQRIELFSSVKQFYALKF